MAHLAHYRRVIVTMREGSAPAPALRLAAELAHLLDLELEGVFVENEALLHLASLPFARELRLPGHTWQSLDAAQLVADFQLAADRAERLFAEAAHALGVASAFSVFRGDPGTTEIQTRPDDILVVVEPEAERPDWPLGRGSAARTTNAGILLAPAHGAARHGPIATVERPGTGLALATALALRSGENLLLFAPEESTPRAVAIDARLPPTRVLRRLLSDLSLQRLARAANRNRARLLIADQPREAIASHRHFLARFVEQTGMPVLLIGE